MAMWNPWRGCRKCSEGCLYCYIHKGDVKHGINTAEIVKTKDFIFKELPLKHKCITAQPLIEPISLEKHLDGIELVVAGGESDRNARPLDYDWVLDIREQCIRKKVNFEFRQCGTHFIKDGKSYNIQTKDLMKQAKRANIDYNVNE